MELSNKFRTILGPVKDIIGVGYGHCHSCGFHWNIVTGHVVKVTKDRGCFAVCEDCWNTKTDEEIIEAYNDCYDEWLKGNEYNRPITIKEIGYTRKQLVNAVKRDLKLRNK